MEPPFSTLLDDKGIFRIQSIVGALLYYARAVDNKLLLSINKLGQQQASATEDSNAALLQLLDYVATYPNNVIFYQASDMVIAGHSDASYLNVRKSSSRSGAHIVLSEDTPLPTRNVHILTVAQIIKFVMFSAAEAEISGLSISAKAMVQLCKSLMEMGWPQPKYPIQYDKSSAVGVSNDTIIQCKTKTISIQYHCLRCRKAQCQFHFFWATGADNLADYSTKNHPPPLS